MLLERRVAVRADGALTIPDLCATGLVRMILGGQSTHGPSAQPDTALH